VGDLEVGDDIIVTRVLFINLPFTQLIGTKQSIIQVDYSDFPYRTFPYKILVADKSFWVEGIPYSSLMMELV